MKDADAEPVSCSEKCTPVPTFAGTAAEHLKTEPGEECAAPGWLSPAKGKAPHSWGRDVLETLVSKKVISVLALR